MNTLLLPVLFAAPLFYSFDKAPAFLQIVSKVNPLTYQLEAMRSIAFGLPDYSYLLGVFVITVCAFIAASICLSRAEFSSNEH